MATGTPATPEVTLATVRRGAVVDVVELPPGEQGELLVHGIRPGARLTVDGDAPFGGPRIVRLNGSRIAIDRRLARSILVATERP
jgi:Fe2+ transport system protein FeoA